MQNLLRPTYFRLGHRTGFHDDHLEVLLRSQIVDWSCSLEMEECCDRVKRDFNKWMKVDNVDDMTKNP
jgi:hypothetical protein